MYATENSNSASSNLYYIASKPLQMLRRMTFIVETNSKKEPFEMDRKAKCINN